MVSGHRYTLNPRQPLSSAFGESRKIVIEDGIKSFRDVLASEPDHTEARLCLGLCLVDKEIDQAEEV